MNGKKVLSGVLLAFVAVAIGFLVLKETRSMAAADKSAAPAGTAAAGTAEGALPGAPEVQPVPRRLVACYFHLNKRCNTCRAIERQAKEAIETGFPEALLAGRLEWQAVNLDEPGNDHYYQDFQLTGSALVLAELVDGKPARFKHLPKTWDLVADRPAFAAYVQGETKAWLGVPQ